MKKKATAPKSQTASKSSGRATGAAVPLSLRREIERELDSWQESEGDDDNCIIKNSLPYSSDPSRGVERMFRKLTELGVPRLAMRRLAAVSQALVALLKKTSIDDLDSDVLLDWLAKEGDLHFVDDLPPRAPSPLRLYSPEERFAVGDRLKHPKFGAGEVVRRLDGKIDVRFQDGSRTLAAKSN